MTMPNIPVSRVAAAWIAAVIVLVIGTIAFAVLGGSSVETAGASTFSRSAIGYAGIADVMHRLGARVIRSRKDSAAKVDPQGVLVVAEPSAAVPPQQMATLLNAHTVLLILPKWTGVPSASHRGWIAAAAPLPQSLARSAAQVASIEVTRVARVTSWSHNEIGARPAIAEGGVQLIKSNRLRPVVGSDGGMLVGEMRNGARRLWILADPDVMQNHGLADPDNAAFAVALLDALRGADGNIVFDEVVHGFEETASSPLRLLFEFPFVLATIQGAIAVALLLWATMRRFGAPLSPPVELETGKRSLIEATANLLDVPRHRPIIIQRYVHAIVQDVARQLHAPAGLSDAGLIAWLGRTARVRDAQIDGGAVVSKVDALVAGGRAAGAPLATLARDIFRWKREVTDAGSRYSRTDRRDPQRGRQGSGRPG
ncbi:MAG TPA: DUF4350 domain-containing protein [Xanthobacteraceae bacterium]|nr:DUF4350 domain-containing protein [Xanthobacteraceae bacterium]